eukprot:13701192-Alexandrium_andersonii.AAC.1
MLVATEGSRPTLRAPTIKEQTVLCAVAANPSANFPACSARRATLWTLRSMKTSQILRLLLLPCGAFGGLGTCSSTVRHVLVVRRGSASTPSPHVARSV